VEKIEKVVDKAIKFVERMRINQMRIAYRMIIVE
jgi:hypothetical protein